MGEEGGEEESRGLTVSSRMPAGRPEVLTLVVPVLKATMESAFAAWIRGGICPTRYVKPVIGSTAVIESAARG